MAEHKTAVTPVHQHYTHVVTAVLHSLLNGIEKIRLKFHWYPGKIFQEVTRSIRSYRKISNISRTNSQNLNDSRLVLHLPKSIEPGC